MNVLFGLAIVLVLMLSESGTSGHWIASDEIRVALLILLTSIPPLFAAGQVCVFHYRFSSVSDFESKRYTLGRFAIWHFAVWLVSSLAIVVLIQWQLTVRNSWQLDRFPAIDEMLILAPCLVSLIVSWFILFETQSGSVKEIEVRAARNEYVSIRCRIYLMIVLIPIAAMIMIKDFWYITSPMPPYVLVTAMLTVLLSLLAFMPWIIGKIWSSRSVSEAEGSPRLLQLCADQRMGVKDILVWDTGQSVVNALVAGVFPKFRVLMMSDLLLKSFPDEEIDAILRHEAGHLRLAHLPIRLAFILLPVAAMFAMDLDPNQTMISVSHACMQMTGFNFSPSLIPTILLILYMFVITAWLSKKMEFEADLYAAGLLRMGGDSVESNTPILSQAMCNALLRFAANNPEQMSESSLTHPSLQQRLDLIKKCSNDPAVARRYFWRFRIRLLALATALLILTGVMLVW